MKKLKWLLIGAMLSVAMAATATEFDVPEDGKIFLQLDNDDEVGFTCNGRRYYSNYDLNVSGDIYPGEPAVKIQGQYFYFPGKYPTIYNLCKKMENLWVRGVKLGFYKGMTVELDTVKRIIARVSIPK